MVCPSLELQLYMCPSPTEGSGAPNLAATAMAIYCCLGPVLPQGLSSTAAPDMGMVHGLMVETKKAPIAA